MDEYTVRQILVRIEAAELKYSERKVIMFNTEYLVKKFGFSGFILMDVESGEIIQIPSGTRIRYPAVPVKMSPKIKSYKIR